MLQHIDMVKCAAKVKRFAKGSIIMQEGDNSLAQMYILLKGSVFAYINLRQPTEKMIATYKSGDFFGENSLFLGQPAAATLIAAEDTISLPISRESVNDFFVEQPEATFTIIESLCHRLQQFSAQPATPAAAPQTTAAKAEPPSAAAKAAPQPAATKAAEQAAAAQAEPGILFPPGHKTHQLALLKADSEYLFMKGYTCPVCGNEFKFLTVKSSKLIPKSTDNDLRVHYSGVEPLHYDIVTCPRCWYSAMTDMFKDGVCSNQQLDQLLQEYKSQLVIQLDENRDSFAVFAGYYLALLCAAKCFRNSDATVGKLWLKLSRLYDDCQDEGMSQFAAEQALKGYMAAYERSNTTAKQNQQLFYIIGELSIRLNDLSSARKFLFQAKIDKGGSPVITRRAEDRIEYLRTLNQEQGGK